MRISLFIECPVRSVNSLKISMGLMADTLKKKSLFHFQNQREPLVQIIQSVPFNWHLRKQVFLPKWLSTHFYVGKLQLAVLTYWFHWKQNSFLEANKGLTHGLLLISFFDDFSLATPKKRTSHASAPISGNSTEISTKGNKYLLTLSLSQTESWYELSLGLSVRVARGHGFPLLLQA